jgi:hypothetical protein
MGWDAVREKCMVVDLFRANPNIDYPSKNAQGISDKPRSFAKRRHLVAPTSRSLPQAG